MNNSDRGQIASAGKERGFFFFFYTREEYLEREAALNGDVGVKEREKTVGSRVMECEKTVGPRVTECEKIVGPRVIECEKTVGPRFME